jgi:enamine deaminase RidA (YjgF/YER057c/UK114 family)
MPAFANLTIGANYADPRNRGGIFTENGTMTIQRIEPKGRASRAVIHNGTVYLAGQVGDAEKDIKGQTQDVLDKIDALLERAGSSKEHVLMATVWLADMADFAALNEVWNDWVVDGHQPARCCGEAKLAREALKVEIMIVAAVAE